jgi:4-hydroxybenzoate polyprenyltransferase
MNLSASAKQALDKITILLDRINILLDKAAHHPVMDRIDNGLQMLKPEIIKAGCSRVARRISENAAVRAVIAYTDTQISRAANSAAMARLQQYAILVRLNKPIGILLLLWPTMISLWIAAQGWPDPLVLLVFVLGVILMRSAGCAINDYADRDIDGSVARTRDRPLVSGKVSETEALIIFATLSICAFALVLLMNRLTIMMSLVGAVLAASYPFMKRYHFLPQVHLGAAFGWTVPMAFTAQANELTPITWLLFLATVLWTTAYDTMYAMADREDDLKIGVKSTAILFGPLDKMIIGIIQAMLIMALLLIGQRAELSGFYYTGVVAATVLAIWQQFLIKDRDPARCFNAFLNNNWFGLVLFIGLVLDYQFKGIT